MQESIDARDVADPAEGLVHAKLLYCMRFA
jgi:hypothetical protein